MIRLSQIGVLVTTLVLALAGPSKAALRIYYDEPFDVRPSGERRFEPGELNGQHGWRSIPGVAEITRWTPNTNQVGVGVRSRGSAFGFETLVTSPKFADIPQPNGKDYVMTMLVGFDSRDVTWYVTPKNVSNNIVITRIKFERGGRIWLLVPDGQGGGAYELVPNSTWRSNTIHTIVLAARADGRLHFAIDQRDVADFTGAAFVPGIEAISIETDNERTGRGMIFDKIRVRDGRIER